MTIDSPRESSHKAGVKVTKRSGAFAIPSHMNTRSLLEDWYQRIRINIDTHNYAERLYDRRNTLLAVINICSIVTLAVLASSVNLSAGPMKALVLALALAGAIASALQIQLSYGEKAAANRLAARQYSALRRAVEVASERSNTAAQRAWQQQEIRRQWDFTASCAPNVPERIRGRAKRQHREPGALQTAVNGTE
jgi:hypothetical protein